MNNKYSISIIIPIYKAEKFICRCLDSLLAQTMSDFEMLLIDDGSPDRCGAICDEYAKKESRVYVVHKKNGGVGAARQTGLDMATGEYVIHVDPDDWVEPDMLECLYDYAKKNDADMVICDYFEHRGDEVHYIASRPHSLHHQDLVKELFSTLHGSCCNKLVRRMCIKKYRAYFPSLALCEDLFFNVNLLLNPLSVCYLNKAFYHYDRTNENSVTREGKPRMGLYAFEACKMFRQLLSDKEEYWSLFVEKEMPWMAYITLYYGNVSGNEFKIAYGELNRTLSPNIIKIALSRYWFARIIIETRKIIRRFANLFC